MNQIGELGVRLVTGENYPPFSSRQSPYGGIAVKVVKKAFEKMGRNVFIDWAPLDLGLESVKQGGYVATFPHLYSEENIKDFYFSEPIYVVRLKVFARKGVGQFDSDSCFANKKISLPQGWTLAGTFSEMHKTQQLSVVEEPSLEACFRSVFEGTTDFLWADYLQGVGCLRSLGYNVDDFDIQQYTSLTTGLHLLAGRSHHLSQELIKEFNRTISRLYLSGVYESLVYDSRYP